MKKVFTLGLMVLFALALVAGCGQQAEQEADKVPVEVKDAEMADSTRLDSMATDMADTAGAVVEEVKEAAGH